jgi:hypothetical protein
MKKLMAETEMQKSNRRRWIVFVALALCAFCLILMISPGVARPKSVSQLVSRFSKERTEENRRAVELARAEARQRQLGLGFMATGLLVFAIVYGWRAERRP